MESKIETTFSINLELNKKEALWLKTLVQNPICCSQEEEMESDRGMREKFWEALMEVQF